MGGPGWLTAMFAVAMLVVAGYCAARLAAARWWRRPAELDADGVHLVMGVAMAGMLASGLRVLPAPVWEAVFGAAAAWFAGQAARGRRGVRPGPWRCPQPVPHLVECGAMVYMLLALPAAPLHGTTAGTAGMAGTRLSPPALALALFMLGYVAWAGDRLMAPGRLAAAGSTADRGSGYRPVLAPRGAGLYKIAMGVTMGYMLIVMP
jgi:hypothetical protein